MAFVTHLGLSSSSFHTVSPMRHLATRSRECRNVALSRRSRRAAFPRTTYFQCTRPKGHGDAQSPTTLCLSNFHVRTQLRDEGLVAGSGARKADDAGLVEKELNRIHGERVLRERPVRERGLAALRTRRGGGRKVRAGAVACVQVSRFAVVDPRLPPVSFPELPDIWSRWSVHTSLVAVARGFSRRPTLRYSRSSQLTARPLSTPTFNTSLSTLCAGAGRSPNCQRRRRTARDTYPHSIRDVGHIL